MINFANYIFDYNGWSSSIKEFSMDYVYDKEGRWFCGLSCIVKVTLKDGAFHEVGKETKTTGSTAKEAGRARERKNANSSDALRFRPLVRSAALTVLLRP